MRMTTMPAPGVERGRGHLAGDEIATCIYIYVGSAETPEQRNQTKMRTPQQQHVASTHKHKHNRISKTMQTPQQQHDTSTH